MPSDYSPYVTFWIVSYFWFTLTWEVAIECLFITHRPKPARFTPTANLKILAWVKPCAVLVWKGDLLYDGTLFLVTGVLQRQILISKDIR